MILVCPFSKYQDALTLIYDAGASADQLAPLSSTGRRHPTHFVISLELSAELAASILEAIPEAIIHPCQGDVDAELKALGKYRVGPLHGANSTYLKDFLLRREREAKPKIRKPRRAVNAPSARGARSSRAGR